ncbi:CD3073 family putative ECF transporter S component [Peptostreptococcus canis]|uniref:ECF transporter S component n=1 Tax=Peptostreptococcus canis TaxID=1159213 RepID=A0ABR6TNL2_9FIRM|nr:CD3073 family putative ECF transporter S component [Peptostreptococcus canis]MBC2576753.1 ECF transporter S component [Peptostreptococcus canis]MBP1998852.1 energy-coupling factor transport system substrate-specific component [Peptostreptococcus canis]
MNNNSTKKLIFSAIGIAINIVLGMVVGLLHIPLLFMDTVGTIFIAVICGPIYGAAVGGITNLVLGVLKDPREIPFLLVNVAIGLIVGFIAKNRKFDIKTAVITGLILAVVAPLIGTPIAVYVYGGITGDVNDIFFVWLKNSGMEIFSSAFIPRITSNIVDKVISCVLVSICYARLKGVIKND